MDDQLGLDGLSSKDVGFSPVGVGLGTEQEIPERPCLFHVDVPGKQAFPVFLGSAIRGFFHHQVRVVLRIGVVRLCTFHQSKQQGGRFCTVDGVANSQLDIPTENSLVFASTSLLSRRASA